MNNLVKPRVTQEDYRKIFHTDYENIYIAPARTNIIGEHLDYNNGSVLPCAISLYIYAYVSKRNDNLVCLYTSSDIWNDHDKYIEVNLDQLAYNPNHYWASYPIGLVSIIKKYKPIYCGFNIYFDSEIPVGCGLSSSAAMLVLTGFALSDIYNLNLLSQEIIDYAVETEQEYIKVNSGIMDESVIVLAKPDTYFLLDCQNKHFEYLPFTLGDYQLLVLNTNKKRLLKDGKFNERVSECQEALKRLKNDYQIMALSSLKSLDLPKVKELLHNDLLYRRVKYVVMENDRVQRFVNEVKKPDIDMLVLAQILNEGHLGLKEDYEVSGLHLDLICELSNNAGAIASRMTGAGFGGCAIAIVKKDIISDYIDRLKKTYYEKTGLVCDIYIVNIVGSVFKYL